MNTKTSNKPVSRYAKKQAAGGSSYWDKTRHLIDLENAALAIRNTPRKANHTLW